VIISAKCVVGWEDIIGYDGERNKKQAGWIKGKRKTERVCVRVREGGGRLRYGNSFGRSAWRSARPGFDGGGKNEGVGGELQARVSGF